MATTFYSASVITPKEILPWSTVVVDDNGKISYVGPDDQAPNITGPRINLRGKYLAPGFIEQHVHGGYGVEFSTRFDGSKLAHYSAEIVKNGITGFLAGVLGNNHQDNLDVLEMYSKAFIQGLPGAEPLGFFMECVCVNPRRHGSAPESILYWPTLNQVKELVKAADGWMKMFVVAPEMPGAETIARYLCSENVIVSLGITAADYDTAKKALDTTHTNIDHICNNHETFHHRKPGTVGAALSTNRPITCEVITDMFHLHPATITMIIRCLGIDRVVFVSDGGKPTGLPDGIYDVLEGTITVKDYQIVLPDGTIASSASPLNRDVRLAMQQCGLTYQEAIQAVTLNPARALGFANRLGSISIGKDASLVVIDEDVNVYMTIIKGRILYQK